MLGELSQAPAELLKLLHVRPAASAAPANNVEPTDLTPEVVEVVEQLVNSYPVAVNGDGSDDLTLRLCYQLRDRGLSLEQAQPVVIRYAKRCGFDQAWTLRKLKNAYKYAKGIAGAKHPDPREAVLSVVKGVIARGIHGTEQIPTALEDARMAMLQHGCTPDTRNVVVELLTHATGWKERKLNLPPAVDPKLLAAKRDREQRFEIGDESVIDPSDPLGTARSVLAATADSEGRPSIVRWSGTYWVAKETHYAELDDDSVRVPIYALEGRTEVGSGAEFKPSRVSVETIEHALRTAARIEVSALPGWINSPDEPPAIEFVPFSNGLLHVPSREFRAPTRRFFTTNATGFGYDPQAPKPRLWLATLRQLWGDDVESIETLQEVFGLALTTDTSHQKAFLLLGPPRSCKGTIARVLTALVGAANVTAPTLNGLGQHFGLQGLISKSLAVISDARLTARTDLGAIAENLLRVTGEDTLSIPRKHQGDFTAKLGTRFLVISNELPGFMDQSGALASRFIILQLTKSFLGHEDRALTAKLLEELPGIANWALEGLDRLRARGYFRQPAASQEAMRHLETLSSPTKAFVEECCEVSAGASVPCQTLYGRWCAWTAEQGREHNGSLPIFSRNLSAALPHVHTVRPRTEQGRERCFEGIRLKP